jgi:hypothetical protein
MITRVHSTHVLVRGSRRRCRPINCTNKGHDGEKVLDSRFIQASIIASTFLVGATEVHAEERAWMPRRHFRRLGEHISPDWAEETAEVSASLPDFVY